MAGIDHMNFFIYQISDLFGKTCCRKRIGRGRSLDIGFGKKILHNKNLIDDFYGEWEVGGYSSSWRFIRDGVIVCGSQDTVSSTEDLNEAVSLLEIGAISFIRETSKFDIRIIFDNGLNLDFMCSSGDDDDMLGIFGPDDLFLGYNPLNGWLVGKANEPSGGLVKVDREQKDWR